MCGAPGMLSNSDNARDKGREAPHFLEDKNRDGDNKSKTIPVFVQLLNIDWQNHLSATF
jgi:hypothetical protein